MGEIEEAIEKVYSGLLSRERDPSPQLVLLMCNCTGLPKEFVIEYLKATRNSVLDWFDANEGLLRYMAASRMDGGRE